MSENRLVKEIERLRDEMERCGRVAALNSRELLQISERLDRLINAYYLRRSQKSGDRSQNQYSGVRSQATE